MFSAYFFAASEYMVCYASIWIVGLGELLSCYSTAWSNMLLSTLPNAYGI